MAEMVLYFDLMSPYSYLAAARAERVLGERPRFEPVFLPGLFAHRGYGPWSLDERRATGMAECERRALAYGLPPIKWFDGWPGLSLHAMRVAVLAKHAGVVHDYAQAVFRRTFADGEHPSEVADEEARRLGVEPTVTQAVKDELRAATDAAHARGVIGVPTLERDGVIFYGDDQLEAAA